LLSRIALNMGRLRIGSTDYSAGPPMACGMGRYNPGL
jgi:hypothetical protein